MAQLAERSLLTPEIRGSNPDIGNELFGTYICQLLSRKDENIDKVAGNGPIKKIFMLEYHSDVRSSLRANLKGHGMSSSQVSRTGPGF